MMPIQLAPRDLQSGVSRMFVLWPSGVCQGRVGPPSLGAEGTPGGGVDRGAVFSHSLYSFLGT